MQEKLDHRFNSLNLLTMASEIVSIFSQGTIFAEMLRPSQSARFWITFSMA